MFSRQRRMYRIRTLDQRPGSISIFRFNERQMHFVCIQPSRYRNVPRCTSLSRQFLEVRLGHGMIAQFEEIFPLRRRHDHRDPHPRLNDTIHDLLMNTERYQLSRLANRQIARLKPHALGNLSVVLAKRL